MDNKYRYWGIDVSKDSLQIATQLDDGSWSDAKITNEMEAINQWLDLVLEAHPSPFFILEHTGPYSTRLAYCLELRYLNFYIMTASQSSGFTKTLKNISKTDKADARNLFVYGQKMNPQPIELTSDEFVQKRELFKHLSTLKEEKRRFENRLHAHIFNPRAVTDSLKQSISFFEQQIQELETELFKDNNPDLEKMETKIQQVVGIGPKSSLAIIVATNGFATFDNPKQVAKFLGISPALRQSGSSVRGKASIQKSANAYVRQCLYMAARSAILHNKACKALYERMRLKGKPYRVAMIAVVHKLVRQIFWVAKNEGDFINELNVVK
jgi:transposase